MISFWFLVSNSWNNMRKYWGICPLYSIGGHSKSTFFEREGGGSWKSEQKPTGAGGPNICVRSLFLKQMLIFSKWSLIVILQVFLLIIIAVWNFKQTIMKEYNIQSCQWMSCYRFGQPFLLCTTFWSFLCTVHYFFCLFSAKMATYSLVIDNVYFVITS